MFNHKQIKWIKSVKHKKGTGWAYLNLTVGEIFDLNFPAGKKYLTNARSINVGEIILLFQKVNKDIHAFPGLYFTHLVVPLTKKVTKGMNEEFPWLKRCEVIAVRELNSLIKKPDNFFLQNRAWGDCRSLISAIKNKNVTEEQIQKQIWNLFFEKEIIDEEVIDDFVSNESEGLKEKIKDALNKIPAQLKKRIVYQSDRQDTPLIVSLKKLYDYKCQFPGCKSRILKKDGSIYIEIAHIIAVKDGGKSIVENLIPLCPNHHKEFDYGNLKITSHDKIGCNGTLNGDTFSFLFKV